MNPEDRSFGGYSPETDERNRNFPVAALFSYPGWSRRYWLESRDILDQGREGACVGFGWTAELMAHPAAVRMTQPSSYAQGVYKRAQKVDVWPGEDYEGTSVLAGAKIVKDDGYIAEYRWAFSVEEIIQSIVELGPVVVGIPWYDTMYRTRPSGLVELNQGARLVGGHCLTITGYNPRTRLLKEGFFNTFESFRWRNSWGPSYGRNGSAYIKVEDFERLFNQFGEACVPVSRRKSV